jgi:hypothetical protein
MRAKQITFTRLHKFAENGAAFTEPQIAAASYALVVGSAGGGSRAYSIPSSLIPVAPGPVTVPFSSVGFNPVPGIAYTVQVVVGLDGVESNASKPVSFTNSFTPAPVEAVSIS